MAKTAFPQVYPYSAAVLRKLLIQKRGLPRHRDAADKRQINYLGDYLTHLGVRTIVAESHYVDHDFLEDFSAYYVRCFRTYERTCQRLHFFRTPFAKRQWDSLLERAGNQLRASDLQREREYVGFVVGRPLPLAVIGRTCLAPPLDARNAAHYPTTREYDVNLCGISLRVETLGFQEQDEFAAKCATAALWSAFQGTAKLFQHAIPSPVEITQHATSISPFGGRAIPNLGLTDEQIGHAIRQVGLEPLLINAFASEVLKATAYAYLRGKIPLLLNIRLEDPVTKGVPEQSHEVAVTGYRLDETVSEPAEKKLTPLVAHRCSCLFVHDDRVGPFAEMGFDVLAKRLTTQWISTDDASRTLVAIPGNLIIPVYHKIRIPFQRIYEEVSHLHELLVEGLWPQDKDHVMAPILRAVEWDIYLTTVNSFKAEVHSSNSIAPQQKRNILQTCLPRFLWRATALSRNKPILDLLFDATDIEQGDLFICAVQADPALATLLRLVATLNLLSSKHRRTSATEILNWFKDNTIATE